MTSEQPTHIKINPQLFLFTRDGCRSMKPWILFLLVQIQRDGFLWTLHRLAGPCWSNQQDSCVSHRHRRDTADSTGTQQIVGRGCGLLWLGRASLKMWASGRTMLIHFWCFQYDQAYFQRLFPILTHTCQAGLVYLVNLDTAWELHSPGHEFLHLLNVTWGWIIACFGKKIWAVKTSAQFCLCFYAQAHEIRNYFKDQHLNYVLKRNSLPSFDMVLFSLFLS